MEWQDSRVLVYGAGKSGIGSALLLEKLGAQPVVYDANEKLDRAALLEKLGEGTRAEIQLGALSEETLGSVCLCVLSPGVPTDCADAVRIREKGIPIWGEVELAYAASKGRVLAITGTNGKTTTTTLTGEIMRYHAHRHSGEEAWPRGEADVFVVGNIGYPYTDAAPETTEHSVCVAEISSFQLETCVTFHPQVSAITNITPDHLNRHHTMAEYIRVKESITARQTPQDTCVLNFEDEELRAFGERLQGKVRVVYFSSRRELEKGMFLRGDTIVWRDETGEHTLINVHEQQLLGLHNYENIMTAALVTMAAGVSAEEIAAVLRTFRAVEHRIEFVREVGGVAYYNDSKGDEPGTRRSKAVEAMQRPTVLIGGGYDKDSAYDEWIDSFGTKVKALVLIGATKEKIAACAAAHGYEPGVPGGLVPGGL